MRVISVAAAKVILTASFCVGVVSAAAAPLSQHFSDDATCYSRTYSAEHLRKNPGQRVSYIRFDHVPGSMGDVGPGELAFSVSVRFKDSPETLTNSGLCFPQSKTYRCQLECDGGGFELKDRDQSSLYLLNPSGFIVSGCDGDAYVELVPEPDDKIFRLDRMLSSECRAAQQ